MEQNTSIVINETDVKAEKINIKSLVNNTPLIIALTFILIGLVLVLTHTKGNLLIDLNNLNTPFLDMFFKYITYYGDAILYAPIAVCFIIVNRKKIIPLIYLLLTQTIFTHLFKKVIFKGRPRPMAFFDTTFFNSLHKVEGVEIHSFYNSFPSGHTITAFSLTFFFVFIYKVPKNIQIILVFFAVLAAISRVYLLQHFFQDVVLGAFLGIISAYIVSHIPVIKIPKLK